MFKKILLSIVLILVCACSTNQPNETIEYDDYQAILSNVKSMDSFKVTATNKYEFTFSDETKQIYDFSSVMVAQDVSGNPKAHLTQDINSVNGQYTTDGYYMDGKLYNNYNNSIKYHEDMSFAELKQTLMVVLDIIQIDSNDVESISSVDGGYLIKLNEEGASRQFLRRYDFYGLSLYPVTKVNEATIFQKIEDNYISQEVVNFNLDLNINESNVNIDFDSSVTYEDINKSEVIIPEDLNVDEYLYYEELIQEDGGNESGIELFKQRLVDLLGYTNEREGVYRSEFNEGQVYIVDFNNNQFTYQNRTSTYVYNWKGNTGGFGSSCNYDYETKTGSDNCQASVIDTLEEVKLYFEMELYYCGLTIEDIK